MGMAASQMRYTMLAGKKSDVEFQGQQINQQRTTLATESSSLNSQLLELTVPTPPSSSDFTTTKYSFSMGNLNCTVGSLLYNNDGTYDMDYSYETTGVQAETGQARYTRRIDAGGNLVYTRGNGTTQTPLINASTTFDPTRDGYDAEEASGIRSALAEIYGPGYDTTGASYYYTIVNGAYQFVTAAQLASLDTTPAADNPGDVDSNTLQYSYVNDNAKVTENQTFENVVINWSDSGRLGSFVVNNPTTGVNTTYTASVNASVDDTAYESAYEEYEYQKGLYTQEMNEINAKLSVVESQDRKLELKLQDLDTQQKAISTEMDAVSKVVEKNIETSFKTFA